MRHWWDIATRPTQAHRCIMALTWCLSLMAGGAALAAPSTAGAPPQCLPSHAAVVPKMLSFSLPPNGNMPALWHGRPTRAIAFTKSERPNRARVVRIALGPDSPATFASLTNCMARDFAGKRITLRGELRTVGVKGFAGLTLIESASDGVLAVESMRAQDLAVPRPGVRCMGALSPQIPFAPLVEPRAHAPAPIAEPRRPMPRARAPMLNFRLPDYPVLDCWMRGI